MRLRWSLITWLSSLEGELQTKDATRRESSGQGPLTFTCECSPVKNSCTKGLLNDNLFFECERGRRYSRHNSTLDLPSFDHARITLSNDSEGYLFQRIQHGAAMSGHSQTPCQEDFRKYMIVHVDMPSDNQSIVILIVCPGVAKGAVESG